MASCQIIIGKLKNGRASVSCVRKERVNGEVHTVERVCGLGMMDMKEFGVFRTWAMTIKNPDDRCMAVKGTDLAISVRKIEKERIVAGQQKKTTVKRAPKQIKEISKEEKRKARVLREKEWFKTLTLKQQKEYKEREQKRRIEEQKELQKKFEKISKKDIKIEKQPVYKINDLIKAQKYEAEIKTLRGDYANEKLIIEREKKIKYILGTKYKTCEEIAIAGKRGEIIIME